MKKTARREMTRKEVEEDKQITPTDFVCSLEAGHEADHFDKARKESNRR